MKLIIIYTVHITNRLRKSKEYSSHNVTLKDQLDNCATRNNTHAQLNSAHVRILSVYGAHRRVCTVSVVRGFYIPGVAPTEYEEGDTLEIKVRCSSVGWWVGCKWAGTVFVGEEDMNHVVVGRGGGRNTLSVEREREMV